MDVRSLTAAEPFVTADGSIIRELLNVGIGASAHQSLAEASVEPGAATTRHYHRATEEIYYVTHGQGRLEVDGEERELAPGDAALIPPGAWHAIVAGGGETLRFLCCCAPGYRHDDTFFV
jgi:mannose-6-phosphate isomerase-like protein (cupin superfamily)